MPSEAKSRAARENGRKSRGPVTPEGKSRSSKNALKHGLGARELVLANEDPDDFVDLAAAYYDKFKPADEVECDLVNEMAFARWRLRRVWAAETALIDNEMDRQGPKLAEQYSKMDEPTRIALAMRELADSSSSHSSFVRYEMRYRRAYSRALKELLLLRSTAAAQNEKAQNEPTPPDPPPPPAAPQQPLTEPAPASGAGPWPANIAARPHNPRSTLNDPCFIHDPQSTFHDPPTFHDPRSIHDNLTAL